MTNLLLSKETMSSLQIAEITGKRHKSVMRDLRVLSEQVKELDGYNFVPISYKDAYGRQQPMYELTKKECLLLASGYDALLRAKIIDRWEELELDKQKTPSTPAIPQSFSEALQLAADQAKQLESQNKVIQDMNVKISVLEKKSDYLDVILESKETITVTQLAQDYGLSAKAMNKILSDLNVQHKVNGQWILYAKFLGEGYIHSKTINITRSNGTKDTVMNTEWRQKGRIFLYNLLKENGILPLIEQ